jgi:ParB-like chromosome segregation protein Spo0J
MSIAYRSGLIELDRIDSAAPHYRITTTTDYDTLAASIAFAGLVNPPIVISKDSGVTVVSGHRRLAALSVLGAATAAVRYLPDDLPETTLIKIAITENTYQRRLNVVEQSRCYGLLSRHFKRIDHQQELLRQLGLPANSAYIKKVLPVTDMPDVIQSHLISGSLSIPIALKLRDLGKELSVRVADLFDYLKIGLNKQRELIQLADEIARRDERPFEEVLWDRSVRDILEDEHKDRGLKVREIRGHLRQSRYPTITIFKERFMRYRDELALPSKVELRPPADFEGADYELKVRFDEIDGLRKQLAKLLELVDQPELKAILKSVSAL